MRATGPVVLAALSLGFGVVVTSAASVRPAPGAQTARGGSYCAAALAVAQYQRHDRGRLDTLIDRALALAHAEPPARRSLHAMRTTTSGSVAFTAALRAFTTYNTGHCCECHAAPAAPELLGRPPPEPGAGT